MRLDILRLIAVTLAMVAATNQGQAAFVVDGGFESSMLVEGTLYAFSGAWSQSGNLGSTAPSNSTTDPIYAKSGQFGAALGPNGIGRLTQGINGLTTGVLYA